MLEFAELWEEEGTSYLQERYGLDTKYADFQKKNLIEHCCELGSL